MGAMKNCSELLPLPDLEFEIDGKIFSVPVNTTFYQTTMEFNPPHRNNTQAQAHKPKKSGPLCMILIENLKKGNKQVFGDVFFKNYYAAFDVEKSQMGLSLNKKAEIAVKSTKKDVEISAGVTLLTASLAFFATYLL